MHILVYENWEDYPEGKLRPFKQKGNPVKNATNYRKIAKWLSVQKKELLIIVKDTDYENCLVGTDKQCDEFIKDCLADLGIMFKNKGHKL